MAGRLINGAAALAELVRPASEADAPGVHRVLPVLPELSALLPGRGLRRGSTVAVAGGRSAPVGGATSLLLALLSAASRAGSWCAVVGVPDLGAVAAEESGIALDRLALVPNPGPDWPTVVGALIDGVDVVVAAVPGPVAAPIASRLAARARQRGSVLVPFGDGWSGADVSLQVTQGAWEGLGQGHGRLRRRRVTVLARGRGAAARPRELTMWMPGMTTPPPIPPMASAPTFPAAPAAPLSPAQASPTSGAPLSPVPSSPASPALGATLPPAPSVLPAPLSAPALSPAPLISPEPGAVTPSAPSASDVVSFPASSSSPSAAGTAFFTPGGGAASLPPSSSSSCEPERGERSIKVVDLSGRRAAGPSVPGSAAVPRSGDVRPGGASRPRDRWLSRRSDGARPGRVRPVRALAGRPVVPVWWEFVPAPVSGPRVPGPRVVPMAERVGARFVLRGKSGLRRVGLGRSRAGARPGRS